MRSSLCERQEPEILIGESDTSPGGLTARARRYTTPPVLRARALVLACFAILLLGACSSGETDVEGGGTAATGATETGPTATGPTATTGEGLTGAVQLDLSAEDNPTGATMYSCDGVEGTWTYDPGKLDVQGVEITMDPAEVNMSGGTGTLVITGEVTLPGAGGAGFTDTVKLRITGTADAPAMEANGIKVEATGALQGVPIDLAHFFPEKVAIPIVAGAPKC
jgi:hypothetical protein